jgi:hypothetical protein
MALLFAITVLLFIRAAFANPAMLLPLFLAACVSIYSIAALNFLIRGIDGRKFLGRSSKDWLKVNAIVSLIFGLMMISQCILFIMHPEMLQSIAAQARQNAGSELQVSDSTFESYLRFTSYFFLVYAAALCIHILLTFQYLRPYSFLFQNDGK